MKIAITHDYLIEYGGAEMVLGELLRLFPQADLYTAFYQPTKKQREFWAEVQKHKMKTSLLNHFPFVRHYHKLLIPFYKNFFSKQDFSKYDLVISSSAGFAKWIDLGKNADNKKPKHIAYIHTPPRFIWGYETSSFHKMPKILKILFGRSLQKWKKQDREYAKKADVLIANSEYIKEKIQKAYKKEAIVINPPAAITNILNAQPTKISEGTDDLKNGFFLTIGRLYPYKHIDLLVKTFNRLDENLIIIGNGPERKNLEKIANPNIIFKGFVEEAEKINLLKNCKAFVFAAEEDFGIVFIEALAAGKPVIAYAKGGALEIVREGKNGVLFAEQTIESLTNALKEFRHLKFSSMSIEKNAEQFSKSVFDDKIFRLVDQVVKA